MRLLRLPSAGACRCGPTRKDRGRALLRLALRGQVATNAL
jgi:hypothetical protein